MQNLSLVKNKINEIINRKQLKTNPKIIVISKTFGLDKIKPLLENKHIHFGENKIQEAENKWVETKRNNKNIQLHMVGKLQTNKAKKAIMLFDYIHSLDNEKLAVKLDTYSNELNKKVKLFIQVNVGSEEQKSGIELRNLNKFYSYCTNELSLNIIGLMCLPPADSDPKKYFELLKERALKLNLTELSMGMSSDYLQAVSSGSTYLRLGTSILGNRNST